MKIFLFSNIISPYRIGLYNELSRLLEHQMKFYFDSLLEDRKWKFDKTSIQFNYELLKSPNIKFLSKVSNNTNLNRTIYFPYKILIICFTEKPSIIISLEMGLRTILSILYKIIYKKRSLFFLK